MRVFLDTNVLVSALATRGICEDVVREVMTSHELVIAPPLFRELRRVLRSKFGVPKPTVDEAVAMLRAHGDEAKAKPSIEVPIKDAADNVMLSCAVNGGAEVFVTGDKELLGLKRVENMRILSPRGFWERIRERR